MPAEAPTPTPTPTEAHAARIRSSPQLAGYLEGIADALATRSSLPVPRAKKSVDPALKRAARDLAVRLLTLDMLEEPAEADVELALVVVKAFHLDTAVTLRQSTGTEYIGKKLPGAKPWQLALTRAFATAALIPSDATAAVKMVLKRVVDEVGEDAPAAMRAAYVALERDKDVSEISSTKVREHLRRAIAVMGSLTERTPADGKPSRRVTFGKAGGRGDGRRHNPWGAAVKFADAFRVRMPPRMYDVRRAP